LKPSLTHLLGQGTSLAFSLKLSPNYLPFSLFLVSTSAHFLITQIFSLCISLVSLYLYSTIQPDFDVTLPSVIRILEFKGKKV